MKAWVPEGGSRSSGRCSSDRLGHATHPAKPTGPSQPRQAKQAGVHGRQAAGQGGGGSGAGQPQPASWTSRPAGPTACTMSTWRLRWAAGVAGATYRCLAVISKPLQRVPMIRPLLHDVHEALASPPPGTAQTPSKPPNSRHSDCMLSNALEAEPCIQATF